MKKLIWILLLLVSVSAFAQNHGATTEVRHGSTLPAACDPTAGQIYFVNNDGLYSCTATDTWTKAQGQPGATGPAGANGADGAPGAPGYSPNQIISGCGVVYSGSGFTFTVSACTYIINNVQYTAPQTTLTGPNADPSLDRYDAIVANSDGTITILEGTPSATPAPPSLDISSQVQITFYGVAAAATEPTNIVLTDIYHENAEWTCAASTNVACNSTVTPHAGTYNVRWVSAVTGNYERHTIPSGNIDLSTRDTLAFWILPDAAWPTTRSLTLQWYNGTTARCTPVTLRDGNFNFNSANLTQQQIVIPTSVFSCAGVPVTRLQITAAGTGTALSFHVDDIVLQGGLAPSTGTDGQGTCGQDWNNSTSYAKNACVFYASTGSSYTALQANTNTNPAANPTIWKVMETHGPAGATGNLQYNGGSGAFAAVNTSVSGDNVTFPGTLSATKFISTDTVNNTDIRFGTGSGGDATCPTPVAGESHLCTQSNQISVSQNGAAYAPIGTGATTPKVCEVVVGDPGAASSALADDNDTPSVCGNDTGGDVTITAVSCYADAGTPTVTPILTGGTGTSILTGALTCGTASWAAGTISGTPTLHTFSANGATCASTPCTLDANITAAGGTAKYIVMRFVLAQ